MDKVRAIIIIANQKAAQEIDDILKMHCPYIEIIGVAQDIQGMAKLISTNNYDLVILGLTTGIDFGFKVLTESSFLEKKELIIINTNTKRTSLTYINCNPDGQIVSVDPSQMILAVHRIKEQLFSTPEPSLVNYQTRKIKHLGIPSLKEVKIVDIDTILYLKSEGKYTQFCTQNNNKFAMSSRNLGTYEKILSQNNFLRVHNSYLVNMDNALNIQKKEGIYLKLVNNEHIPVSKRKKDILFNYLRIS